MSTASANFVHELSTNRKCDAVERTLRMMMMIYVSIICHRSQWPTRGYGCLVVDDIIAYNWCRPGTALDAVALDRATSIYLVDGVIPMLPRLLCEELCSLTPGAPHLTFSIIWRLAPVSLRECWRRFTTSCTCMVIYSSQSSMVVAPTKPEACLWAYVQVALLHSTLL